MASKRKAKIQEQTERIFSKHYRLKSKEDVFILPDIEAMHTTEPFSAEQLVAMREELNETKSLLNDKDIEPWRRHTSKTNPCGLVVKHLRDVANPELCTQAWAKFYEIVSSCDVVPASCVAKRRINSLHLCEAPGAFVASLNHYIKSRFEEEMEWNWVATTLNPFYEGNDTKQMIEGEKFILETEEHWNFGYWYDGNIMDWDNFEHLQQAMKDYGKADIVTADGSIDCADEPEKQEIAICQLLYCEVITAITLLTPGGSFILKMFTMFEHNTVCLLYLLCCFFTKIVLVKPGTSKAGNSEVYCVCTGFIGAQQLSEQLLEKLQTYYTSQPPVKSLFPLEVLPAKFLESISGCAETFSAHQRTTIMRNIELFNNISKGQYKFLHNLRQYVAEEYVRRFEVTSLDRRFSVVSRAHLNGGQLSCWPDVVGNVWHHCGHHTGCYQERIEMTKLGWRDRVVFPHGQQSLVKNEEELVEGITQEETVNWLPGPSNQLLKLDLWTVKLGRSIQTVASSRFCSASLIAELNEARSNASVLRTAEGRDFVENVERLAKEKLGLATPRSGILGVLRNCALLDKGEGRSRVVDISGNCRFICELAGSGLCDRAEYIGLFCRNCCAQSPFPKVDSVFVNSCLNCDEDVARQMKSLADREDRLSVVKVICGSVFASCGALESSYCELASRAALVNQCLQALRLLDVGDSFVCEVSDTLTQFTVGVVYVLHQLFQEITLCPVAHMATSSPRQFLVCRSYLSSQHAVGLTAHLAKVFEVLRRKPCEKDVVSLVPISELFSEKFYKFMRGHTTRHVETQLNCIVNLERSLLAKICTA